MGGTRIVPGLRPDRVTTCLNGKDDFSKNLQLNELVEVGKGKYIRLLLSQTCKYAIVDSKNHVERIEGKNFNEAKANAVRVARSKNLPTFPAIIPKNIPPYGDKPPALKLP